MESLRARAETTARRVGPTRHTSVATSRGELFAILLAALGLLAVATAAVLTLRPVLGTWAVVGVLVVAALAFAALLILTLTLSQALRARVRQMRDVATEIGLGDLTARAPVTADDDLGVLGLALNTMADRIARQMQANRDLLAGVSHELRSPLTRIDVLVELLRGESPSAAAEELIAEIAEETALLERYISRLLEAQRVGLDRVLLQREPMDLADLLTRVLRRETRRLEQLGFDVRLDLDRLPYAEVAGDDNALDRVIATLIENAIQHAGAASASVPPGHPLALRIEAWREEIWAVVAVSDRGPGVTQEQCPQLFEAFFRGDLSRKLGTGGSGLGLYLVRKLTEAHGGHVRAMPRQGGGLTIELRLPLLSESVERETMRLSKAEVTAALERETGQQDPGGG